MAKKLELLVDMDNTVVDLMTPWIASYNAEMAEDDEELRIEDITGPIDKHARAGKRIYDFLNREDWFLNLPVFDGAVEVLRGLHEQGHRIHICTSPGKSEYAPSDKFRAVRKHFPFLKLPEDLIIAHDKHKVFGDVLIDDNPRKAGPFKERWPNSKVIGIAWPFNKNESDLFDFRAASYKDPAHAWMTLVSWVEKLAEELG